MIDVSFIIPAYNASSTILKALDSIYSIDLGNFNFEIIVIDDCSIDDTKELVRQYMSSHSEITLLCQQHNHKQGAARNWGIMEATGEYIAFVDADDIVLDGLVSAISLAKDKMLDVVYCSCYHDKSTSETVLKEINLNEDDVMSGIDFCEKFQQDGVFWYPWGLLYKKDFLISLNYPFVEDRQHEDRDWLAYVLSCSNSVANCKKPMYRYVCNPSSTCRCPKYSTIFDHVASGIRHIDLSKSLVNRCPNLSKTLYEFGVDEIYKSTRLRNLTKYQWSDNKNFYDENHLKPLLPDLMRICKENRMPLAVICVVYLHMITLFLVFVSSPIARIIRKKHIS